MSMLLFRNKYESLNFDSAVKGKKPSKRASDVTIHVSLSTKQGDGYFTRGGTYFAD